MKGPPPTIGCKLIANDIARSPSRGGGTGWGSCFKKNS